MDREQLLQYKQVYDENPFSFCIIKAVRNEQQDIMDCIFEYANPAMAKMFSTSTEEITGKKYLDVHFYGNKKNIAELFNGSGNSEGYGTFFYNSSSSNRFYNIQYYMMPDDRCACFIMDVSKREAEYTEQMKQLYLSSSVIFTWRYNISLDCYENFKSLQEPKSVITDRTKKYEDMISSGYVNEDSIGELKRLHSDIASGKRRTSGIIHINTGIANVEWLKITYSTEFNQKKKPVAAVAIGENITETVKNKRRYDEEMRNQEAVKNKNLVVKGRFNISKNLVETCESKRSFNMVNTGMTYDNAVELLVDSALTKGQKTYILSVVERKTVLENFYEGKNHYSFEYQRCLKNGQIRWVNTIVRYYEDPESGDVKAFIYTYDTEEEKTSKEIVEKIVDLEFEFLGLVSVYSGRSRSICMTNWDLPHNRNAELDFDKGVEEFAKLYIPDENKYTFRNELNLTNIKHQLELQDIFNFISPVALDGRITQKKWVFTYLDESRNNIIHIRSDVTEIFERQAQQKEELESALGEAKKASKSKSDFLARMSHDIRTPMNAIIGMTQLAMKEDDIATIREYLGKIDISSQFLLGLINDILDMNTIENGNITLNYQPYACSEFENYLESVFRPLCNQKNIEFNIDFTDIKGLCLIADRLRINQIFMNLISNAVKFTPVGGKVELTARNLNIKNGFAEFDMIVKDNGIGMSEDFQRYMFEPFSQERNDACQNIKGTGLGLSIVKKLVELLGGTIEVNSTLGKGTEFIIHYKRPIYKTSEDESGEDDYNSMLQQFSLNGYKVLICEDHPMNMEIVCRLLEKEGMIPIKAENGEEGVKYFSDSEEYEIAAVLMDIHMPLMNGLEATKLIRSMPRRDSKTVPIIAMTANAFDEDVKATMAAGMNEHLTKPYKPRDLIRILKMYISYRKKI